MRKRLIKLTLFGVFIVGCAFATEMRSPWLTERGPIRYKFERGNPDRYSLDIYSAAYGKFAHKAFMSHGTDTKPLSALFFNKDSFYLVEALEGSSLYGPNNNLFREFHNPYLAAVKITPRVTYQELGMNLGGRFEYPVYEDKGRIGLRANIPFRYVRLERDDTKAATDASDHILRGDQRIVTGVDVGVGGPPTTALPAKYVITNGQAYRLSLIRNLKFIDKVAKTYENVLDFGGAATDVKAFNAATYSKLGEDYTANGYFRGSNIPFAVISGLGTGRPPLGRTGAVTLVTPLTATDGAANVLAVKLPDGATNAAKFIVDDTVLNQDYFAKGPAAAGPLQQPGTNDYPAALSNLPANGIISDNKRYVFKGGAGTRNDYSGLAANTVAALDTLNDLWVTTIHDENGAHFQNNRIEELDLLLQAYNSNVFEWLDDNDFVFRTNQRTGFGDIDLDFFYEHMFSDEWCGEVFLGVRFPTGADDEYYGNPYKAHLGNGEHWELRFGGMVAWDALSWMNIKLDLTGAYAFEATEERAAVYQGSRVKNIGPKVDADVDWWYFIARLDFTFFHPKTKDLSTTIGYEFYYKTEDDINFKQATRTSWLGRRWDVPTGTWIDYFDTLDNGLAEKNTEAIGHKIRFEGRYQLCQWLEAFAGGSYIFAGQNIPRESDFHGGVNVRF